MIRIGDVPFINSKPLFYPLEKGIIENSLGFLYSPPNILSDLLYNKEIDLGLIPIVEFLTRGSYKVLPDISISSFGKVDSVILISSKEIKDIQTVALDRRSQSSSNLLKVIFNNFYGKKPDYIERDYGEDFLSDVDAGMIIGDDGLRHLFNNGGEGYIYDLGEIWTEKTGLPFVYAVLAINRDVNLGAELDNLLLSKQTGLNFAEEFCEMEYTKIGVSKEFCINYVTNRIHYDLRDMELSAIREFTRCLNQAGIETLNDKIEIYAD